MTSTEFEQQKQEFTLKMWPHKAMELSELMHVGENIFSLQGIEIPAEDSFVSEYDHIIGINGRQRKMVKDASGETGLTNYRNYINVANNIQKPTSVVVIASPQNHLLSSIIPIVDEYIAPSVFFDFAEMMANETGFTLSDIKFSGEEHSTITISFANPNSQPHKFGKGEEFLTDGFYLTWQPASIELGHYYERLVCSNGQTVEEQHRDARTYKLSADEMKRIIAMVKNKHFAMSGVEQFGFLIERASNARISLGEMRRAQRLLLNAGTDSELTERLIPCAEVQKAYKAAGYYDRHKEHLIKGEGTIWDTYNILTAFASHTDIWTPNDHRRIDIMNGAVKFLNREPDIINYYDIY